MAIVLLRSHRSLSADDLARCQTGSSTREENASSACLREQRQVVGDQSAAPGPQQLPAETVEVPPELLYLSAPLADYDKCADTDRFDEFLAKFFQADIVDVRDFRDSFFMKLGAVLYAKETPVCPSFPPEWEGWKPVPCSSE